MIGESGLEFNFTYAEDTSWEQIIAFETAGLMWSDYITDNMTVNIHVEMTDTLPDNVIGGALPAMMADINYTNFRNAYQADSSSWFDRTGFDSLSILREGSGGIGPNGTWEKFEARIDVGDIGYIIEDSAELNMTRANAKALGLISADDTALDGYILMNDLEDSSVDWNYNVNSITDSSLDFLSTAVHEVGHVLGFVSGVDKYDAQNFSNMNDFWSYFGNNDNVKQYANRVVDYANPLDLFRYSDESLATKDNNNVMEMSVGTQAYFGPAKRYYNFATGKERGLDGDGFQASHWKQNDNDNWVQGIMDPLMKLGKIRRISNRDLIAMDMIGYDINTQAHNLINSTNASKQWIPVTGNGTSIDDLQDAAKEHIARSTYSDGQASWVDDWMATKDVNTTDYMTSDRTDVVQNMIDESRVYQARSSRRNYATWQEAFYARSSRRNFANWQEAYFAEFSWQEFDLESFDTPVSRLVNADLQLVTIDLDNDDASFANNTQDLNINSDRIADSNKEFSYKREITVVELDLLEITQAIKTEAKESDMQDLLLLDDRDSDLGKLTPNEEVVLVMPLAV